MSAQPRYKSELYIPIRQDNKSFEQRQRDIFDDAEQKFKSQDFRKEFGKDFDKDFGFFSDSPLRSSLASSFGKDPFGDGDSKSVMDRMEARMRDRRQEWDKEIERMRKDFFSLRPSSKDTDTIKSTTTRMMPGSDNKFQVSFDVSQFKPEEVQVRTQDRKLIVHAKHDEEQGGRMSTREFSRQVDLPRDVDVEKLVSTLSNDGILQVEMEVPAPSYESLRNGSATSTAPSGAKGPPGGPHSTCKSSMTSARSSTTSSEPLGGASLFGSSSKPMSGLRGPTFKQGPVITQQDGSSTLKMEVDIGKEFLASDLNIKTVDRKLQIHAKHEETSGGRTSSREFSREFDLPDDVDPDSVTASMTDEGKLIIEAPISSYNKGTYTAKPGSSKQPTVTVSLKKS